MTVYGLEHMEIGQSCEIHPTASIRGKNVVIEDHVKIGEHVNILAENIFIGKNSIIGSNNQAELSERFSLGKNSILGKSNSFHGRKFEAGEFLYMGKQNEIGGGGSQSQQSTLKLGKYCMVVDRVILNLSDAIEIGDDVGIGTEVMIWTHGSYNAVLDGFPANFAPVKIGSHVWIPARIVILPGVEIGNNVVIGINSLVNKSIPSGAMAAGMPAKIIKENYYPKHLTNQEKDILVKTILEDYKITTTDKNIEVTISYENGNILLISPDGKQSGFNIYEMTWQGEENIYFEDLRDYLRRRGIKFFTDNMFRSIETIPFKKLNQYNA